MNRTSMMKNMGAVFLAATLLAGGCSKGNDDKKMPEMKVPVTAGMAVLKDMPVQLRQIGRVEASTAVSVRPQIGGQLVSVLFREGRDVKKGDLLFRIDPRPYEAALRQAEANLARDAAKAKNAEETAGRYRLLFEKGLIAKDQLDQVGTNAESLDAQVRADAAAVENARLQLEYTSIGSPVDGRIGGLLVHEGNVVKANETVLATINRIRPIYVSFSVPERNLSELRRYMARGSVRVEALIEGEEDRPECGSLTFINNTVDAETGTILLRATFGNESGRLWPGQFVQVVLTLVVEPEAVVVPGAAVQTGQQGSYVFTIRTDNTVEMRPVTVGRVVEGEAVIKKGISARERIVTDGHLRLFPGAAVEIKDGSEESAVTGK